MNVERKLVPLDAGNRIDVPGMIAAMDSNTKIVVICNPNNPTGTDLTLVEIEAITAAAPDESLVFIDEAYIEFLEDVSSASAVEFCRTKKNVLVARTFSKIYGLAGLRIGYGISSNEVIGRLKVHMLGGLSLNMPGVLAATAALDDQEHISNTLQLTHEIHDTWARSFNSFGWKMTPTKTSFCWVDLGFDCAPLVRFLSERGVLISGGQRWNLANCVRISTGTLEENDRLLHAAKAFVSA